MKVSNTFCAYPFVHQYLELSSKVSVCCYNPEGRQANGGDLISQFNSPRMNKLRRDMLDGKRNPICNHCYNLEDRGITSPRQFETKTWTSRKFYKILQEHIDLSERNLPLHPISHDVRFSNKCALKCKTCIPENSSSINAENHKFKSNLKEFSMFTPIQNQNKNKVDDIPISKKTRWIYLVGGEPLVEEKNTQLLEKVVELKIDPVIVINTSMARKNNKLKNILQNFTNVNYIISIDAYGKLNDYIRSGSEWETVVENLNSIPTNQISGFNTVVSMYNIHRLRNIVEWIGTHYPDKHHFISRAVYHQPTELYNVPYLIRSSIIKECIDLFSQYKHHGLQDVATFLKENNYSEKGFQKFIEFTKILDERRNESIHDAEPLWSPYFA